MPSTRRSPRPGTGVTAGLREVHEWLEKRPRVHRHFTPTSASGINQVQAWFSIIHRKALRRSAFRSVPHLNDAIQRLTDSWTAKKHPFAWGKTAAQTLARPNHRPISDAPH